MTEWTPAALERLWAEIAVEAVEWPCVARVDGRECECKADMVLAQTCGGCGGHLRSPTCVGHIALLARLAANPRAELTCKHCGSSALTYAIEELS